MSPDSRTSSCACSSGPGPAGPRASFRRPELFLGLIPAVVLPVLAATLMGKRADPVLARMNRVTTTYEHQINAGIAFFFAVLLLYSGLK